MLKALISCSLASLVAVSSSQAQSTPAKPAARATIVHAGHMLDGLTATLGGPVTVTVIDGRITAVQSGIVTVPGAEVIDLGDATLMPGLIDVHKHMGPPQTTMNPFQARLTISSLENAIGSEANARKLLEEGFTTVRNMGSGQGLDLALKHAIDRGWAVGPRILVSLEPLGPTAGHSDPRDGLDAAWTNADWVSPDGGGAVVDGAAEVVKQVREHKRRGADVLKIMPSGGVLSIGDDPRAQLMTDEEIKAAIDTAHSLGMKVAAHAHGKQAIDAAVRLGIDSIEHGTFADAQTYALMKQHGTYLVPTLLVAGQVNELARLHPERLGPSATQKALELTPLLRGNLANAYKAGVKIAFGTDTSVGHNAHEFVLMVDAGMTPADALFTATRNAADLLGVTGKAGAIQPGAYADLIAVKANPLEDVSRMEQVDWVMKGGVIYKCNGVSVPQQAVPGDSGAGAAEDY